MLTYTERLRFLETSLPADYRERFRAEVAMLDGKYPLDEAKCRTRALHIFSEIDDKASWHYVMRAAREANIQQAIRTAACCNHEFGVWRFPLGRFRGYRDRVCGVCEHIEIIDSTG